MDLRFKTKAWSGPNSLEKLDPDPDKEYVYGRIRNPAYDMIMDDSHYYSNRFSTVSTRFAQ